MQTLSSRSRLLVALVFVAAPVAFAAAAVLAQGRAGGVPVPFSGGAASPQIQILTGTGLILGRVVDAGDRSPIASATVTLNGSAPQQPGAGRAGTPAAQPGGTPPPNVIGQIPTRRVLTDGQGRFVFRDLPKATYRISVSAAGFLASAFGQKRPAGPSRPIDLDTGQRFGDASILMWKFGAISGTVLDDGGEPAVSTTVRLLSITEASGRGRFSPGNQTQTDDRGFFRFGSLQPGDYAVVITSTVTTMPTSVVDDMNKANSTPPQYMPDGQAQPGPGQILNERINSTGAPFPSASGVKVADGLQVQFAAGRGVVPASQGADGRVYAYTTVYYPSASVPSQATTLTVTPGEERRNVDFQLRVAPSVSISGTLVGPPGTTDHFGLRLLPAGADELSFPNGFESGQTITDAYGAFTFAGITPGAYSIRGIRVPQAQAGVAMDRVVVQGANGLMLGPPAAPQPAPLPSEPTLWAETPIQVGDRNIVDVRIPLQTGLVISGRLQFDGSLPRPAPEALLRMRIAIQPADGRSFQSTPQARISADGTFTTQGLPPGSYFINAGSISTPAGAWMLKGVMSAGRDASVFPIALERSDVGGVSIVFTDQPPAELSGNVRLPSPPTDSTYTVFVFPANPQAWTSAGQGQRAMRAGSAAPNGSYRVTGIPAGDYLVTAIDDAMVPNGVSAKFFEAMARSASRVSIAEGEKKTLDVSVAIIR